MRYLVPAWVTPSSLQPVLAAAVGAPLKAVEAGGLGFGVSAGTGDRRQGERLSLGGRRGGRKLRPMLAFWQPSLDSLVLSREWGNGSLY